MSLSTSRCRSYSPSLPRFSDAHFFSSNILIGLLSHLKRNQPKGKKLSNITRGRPLPALITKATAVTASTNEKPNPVSAFAAVKSTATRPLPVPIDNIDIIPSTSSKRQQPIVIPKGAHPIPLPSFATLSRSLPAESFLTSSMASRSKATEGSPSSDDYIARRDKEANSDGYEQPEDEDADVVANDPFPSFRQNKEKKALKHLWHAALTLILERGRPVTRMCFIAFFFTFRAKFSNETLQVELLSLLAHCINQWKALNDWAMSCGCLSGYPISVRVAFNFFFSSEFTLRILKATARIANDIGINMDQESLPEEGRVPSQALLNLLFPDQ